MTSISVLLKIYFLDLGFETGFADYFAEKLLWTLRYCGSHIDISQALKRYYSLELFEFTHNGQVGPKMGGTRNIPLVKA